MKIALAQINPTVGDFVGNTQKIVEFAERATALGADLVGVGRLYVYGLAAAGKAGIVRVLELLEDEVVECLGLLGLARFGGLDRTYLRAVEAVTEAHVHSAFPLLSLPEASYR